MTTFEPAAGLPELLVQTPDALVVGFVVAGHVEHRDARDRLPCPHDAFDAAVNVVGENYHVGDDIRQIDRCQPAEQGA